MRFGQQLANNLSAHYDLNKGKFRSGEKFSFSLCNETIRIEIVEDGFRDITITAKDGETIDNLYYMYLQPLEKLLRIFDGAFPVLKTIKISGSAEERIYRVLETHLMIQRLKYFSSGKNYSPLGSNRLVLYENVLTEDLFTRWQSLLRDLGVTNQVYLYATCDSSNTIDVECAFLVELSESLVETIEDRGVIEKEERHNLKDNLRCLLKYYGNDIFNREKSSCYEKILQCLVNTRVNIMHVKKHQKKPSLNGYEATLYAMKMDLVYRVAILSILGIDESIYKEKLVNRISSLDHWGVVLENLLLKLER